MKIAKTIILCSILLIVRCTTNERIPRIDDDPIISAFWNKNLKFSFERKCLDSTCTTIGEVLDTLIFDQQGNILEKKELGFNQKFQYDDKGLVTGVTTVSDTYTCLNFKYEFISDENILLKRIYEHGWAKGVCTDEIIRTSGDTIKMDEYKRVIAESSNGFLRKNNYTSDVLVNREFFLDGELITKIYFDFQNRKLKQTKRFDEGYLTVTTIYSEDGIPHQKIKFIGTEKIKSKFDYIYY